MGIIIAIVLLISAGVSFGAESSLPGDTLYPVKIGVNETVQGWVALSGEAEAEHRANLALRRLEEAEKLKAEGRLDAETKAKLESEFKMYAEEADEGIWELEADGKTEEAAAIRADLQTSIRTRGNVLGVISLDGSVDSDTKIEIEEEGEKRIVNDKADLKLVHKDGTLTLSGKLMRSTPCVDWKVETVATKDMPSSNVTFNLTKKSTAEVCVQVLGEPQEVSVKIPNVSASASVKINLEGEVVYSGKAK